MLAEPLSSSAVGFLAFVVLLLASVAAVPLAARGIRHFLPASRRPPIPVEPVRFGSSQMTRRSPRHAVLLHRSLLTTAFIVLIALFLIPCAAVLRGSPGCGSRSPSRCRHCS
jgi:hypothetical protein